MWNVTVPISNVPHRLLGQVPGHRFCRKFLEDTATPAVRAEPGLGQVPGPLQKPTASDPER